MFFKKKSLEKGDLAGVIEKHSLRQGSNLWHYSFDPKLFANEVHLRSSGGGIWVSHVQNKFSPAFILSNGKKRRKIINEILGPYDPNNKLDRKVFWSLQITNFEDFLDRRTSSSSRPKKHFPTKYTYPRIKSKIKDGFKIKRFEEEFFVKNFDRLKKESFSSGKEVLLDLRQGNHPSIDDYLKIALVQHEDEIVAIGLLVDDGRSLSLASLSAKRSNLSFGVFLCAEIVRFCSENNYSSFDAGVSALYGVYKDKIFLDSYEIFRPSRNLVERAASKIRTVLCRLSVGV